jgi:ABC-2 type transport system permease protein
MRKAWVVFKREFLQTARKKSFWIMTILLPFLMGALLVVPGLIVGRSFESKRVAVLDGTGRLAPAFEPKALRMSFEQATRTAQPERQIPMLIDPEYVAVKGDTKEAAKPYLERMTRTGRGNVNRLDGVVAIPADVFENPDARLIYYSRSATDIIGQREVGRVVGQAVSRQRLLDRGIDPALIDRVLQRVSVDAIQVSSSGTQKKGSQANFFVGFFFAIFLLLPAIIYGVEIMRGIAQEKTDRVVEILISSMSPLQLLGGKVIGLAAAGLAQIFIWMAMAAVALVGFGGIAAAASVDLSAFIRPSIAPLFLIFYLLGFFLYISVYAVGGAIANSEKEAQQAVMPVMFLLMLPWFLIAPIVLNPDGRMAVVLSLIPIFTPMTMFVRVLLSEPPFWQVAISIVLSALTVCGMFWVAAKIFRVGILSYGKRPTIPELWRWIKVA